MKSISASVCGILLIALVAGCASTERRERSGGVDVARFHLGEPVARAQIAIEPFDQGDANRPEFPAYAAAVARQLARLGWTVVPTRGQSEQVALIDVEQGSRAAIAALAAARIGRGLAPQVSAGRADDRVATLLEVAIRRRSDGTVFWEGRGVGEEKAGAPEAAASTMVEKLAEAVFRDFPGESGRTIRTR